MTGKQAVVHQSIVKERSTTKWEYREVSCNEWG